MLPPAVRTRIEAHLGLLIDVQRQAAGHGALAYRVRTATAPFFVKIGKGQAGAQIDAEALGLQALAAASPLPARVILGGTEAGVTYLVLEWIEATRRTAAREAALGEALADLHRHSAQLATPYGFASDNFIGATPQINTPCEDWPTFFRACRLEPQVALAQDRGLWHSAWMPWLDRLYARLEECLPLHPPPSLLHGDLWSGNVLYRAGKPPVLIDPAVYHGDREADLAMTRLFGGFGEAFYEAYEATWPVDAGASARSDLYNLYHLLNHLNLFGRGYAADVERILRAFGS